MTDETSQHVVEAQLEAYVANSLPEAEVANIEEHLLFCESCQDQVESLERYNRAMRSAALRVTKEEQEAAVEKRDRWAWLRTPFPVWAGAMAVLLLVVGIGVQQRDARPGPAVDVELQANRGPSLGTAPAGHALNLRLDNRGIEQAATYRVEIVDSQGKQLWTGTGTWQENEVRTTVSRAFQVGTYYVRLLKQGEEPVREYQLVVQ